ncbi:hypothetical protein [Frankia sp. AgB32]|uniref:hypothetical protein n=1 Tax=Frankia sp. AgB32 TaxID=631119 RepID=UPI00200FC0A6|nr:hypothetical protein [Frankia sp. AgB32]MCK9896971.1 hypothetical protein [Frankia sp. AgB32]
MRWETRTPAGWVHRCRPPMVTAMTASGWAPELPAGQVWYCGCGQPYGVQAGGWMALGPEETVTLLGVLPAQPGVSR